MGLLDKLTESYALLKQMCWLNKFAYYTEKSQNYNLYSLAINLAMFTKYSQFRFPLYTFVEFRLQIKNKVSISIFKQQLYK